jgi:hypothetical protein
VPEEIAVVQEGSRFDGEDFLGSGDGFEVADIIVETYGEKDEGLERVVNLDAGSTEVEKEFGVNEGVMSTFGGNGKKSYGFTNLGRKSEVLGNAKKRPKKDDPLTVNANDAANGNHISLISHKRILTGT